MTPRALNLHGLSLAEAEPKIRKFVADVQDEALADYEIALVDRGANPDELADELARYRAELAELRERAFERLRVVVARGGADLQ